MLSRRAIVTGFAVIGLIPIGQSATAQASDYFRASAAIGKPYKWQWNATQTAWVCWEQGLEEVLKNHTHCPEVQTWMVAPPYKNLTSLGYFFASVDGSQGWTYGGSRVCFNAASFHQLGVFHVTSTICPNAGQSFSTSLGGLYVPPSGSVLVFGAFETSPTYTSPRWRSVSWNYN